MNREQKNKQEKVGKDVSPHFGVENLTSLGDLQRKLSENQHFSRKLTQPKVLLNPQNSAVKPHKNSPERFFRTEHFVSKSPSSQQGANLSPIIAKNIQNCNYKHQLRAPGVDRLIKKSERMIYSSHQHNNKNLKKQLIAVKESLYSEFGGSFSELNDSFSFSSSGLYPESLQKAPSLNSIRDTQNIINPQEEEEDDKEFVEFAFERLFGLSPQPLSPRKKQRNRKNSWESSFCNELNIEVRKRHSYEEKRHLIARVDQVIEELDEQGCVDINSADLYDHMLYRLPRKPQFGDYFEYRMVERALRTLSFFNDDEAADDDNDDQSGRDRAKSGRLSIDAANC